MGLTPHVFLSLQTLDNSRHFSVSCWCGGKWNAHVMSACLFCFISPSCVLCSAYLHWSHSSPLEPWVYVSSSLGPCLIIVWLLLAVVLSWWSSVQPSQPSALPSLFFSACFTSHCSSSVSVSLSCLAPVSVLLPSLVSQFCPCFCFGV